MIASVVRRWGWRAALTVTGGVRVHGAPPRGACVVVANHSSHADTPALLAALPARTRPVVVAAADYWFGRRTRSWLCRLLVGGFPVRRGGGGSADLAAVSRVLAAGRTVVMYPEGTRSRDGDLGRFRSGAARLATTAGVPLVPAAITGTRQLLPVHGTLRRAPVAVRFGPAVDDIDDARLAIAALVEGGPTGWSEHMTTATATATRTVVVAVAPARLSWWKRCWWALFRLVLSTVGRLSAGVRLGYEHGFDSGTMLDYVYTNRARGALGAGRLVDRSYLDAVGWRAIRARADLLVNVIRAEIRRRDGQPVRILDVAAGPGRYLQEVLESLPAAERDRVRVLCRDLATDGLRRGRELAAARGLNRITYETGDALEPEPTDAQLGGPPDVIVVSGLYELLLDEHVIQASMARLRRLLAPGGMLVFTTQVHHPQLELIANVLPNRHGQPWVMTCRPVAETERWARAAGFSEVTSSPEPVGLFTVTTARNWLLP